MRGWFSSPRRTGRDSCPVIRLSPTYSPCAFLLYSGLSPGADEWSRAASAHPPFRFLVSQAGAALHLDRGSFTEVTRQLISLSIHRDGCPGRYPRPWATTTALSPYRTPERACSRRSRSYTDRRGDGVLRSPFVSLSGSGPCLLYTSPSPRDS